MKAKLLFCMLFLSLASVCWSNPIAVTPAIKFSELYFDANKNWSIELYFQFPRVYKSIDSVIIKSSGAASKLNIHLRDSTYLYVITSDSLVTPLSIDPASASITIETYCKPGFERNVYTDWISSGILARYPGCSLCKTTIRRYNVYSEVIFLAKTPTLGGFNNLTGLGEKMTGHLYDKDGKPVTNYFKMSNGNQFYLEIEEPITLNSDGTYSTIIYPHSYYPDSVTYTRLVVRIQDFGGYSQYQDIDPLSFSYIHPDTVIVRDIHLKSNDYVVTGVEKADRNELPKNTELTLINYPNPFNPSTNFFVKFPDDIKEKSGEINIYNAAGKMVRTISIKNGSTSYWDGKDMNGSVMASGIYYYQLNIKNNVLKSGSMILLK